MDINSNATKGGKRAGAGRPRKGTEPRVPVTFSVDPETRSRAQVLRQGGYPLNTILENLVAGAAWVVDSQGKYTLVLDAQGIAEYGKAMPFANPK